MINSENQISETSIAPHRFLKICQNLKPNDITFDNRENMNFSKFLEISRIRALIPHAKMCIHIIRVAIIYRVDLVSTKSLNNFDPKVRF